MKNIIRVLLLSIIILIVSITPVKAETLSNRLKGRILLQVESKGEAWYVNPVDSKRYYMANGSEAYNIMHDLGVGITNINLAKIKSDKIFAEKQKGKIFLQIERHGEAYYIDINGVTHYLKDGPTAYGIMCQLGLGIKTSELDKIDVSDKDKLASYQIYSIGDSLTASGTPNGQEHLDKLLSFLGNKWNSNNLGVGGYATPQMLSLSQELLYGKERGYVIIWGGINDIMNNFTNETIKENLQVLYSNAHNSGLKVISINISPFKNHVKWTPIRQNNLEEINSWISNNAINIDYKIDIYSLLEDPKVADTLLPVYDYGEHLHLTNEGQDVVGKALYTRVAWDKLN